MKTIDAPFFLLLNCNLNSI